MQRSVLCLLFIVSLVCAVRPGFAQEQIAVAILAVDDRRFPNVAVVMTADQDGSPIVDLAPGSLQIQESGAPGTGTAVQVATDSNIPLGLVLALDVSGSMEEGDTLVKAQGAAISLINSLSAADSVAVLSFADEVRIEQPFTQDKALVASAVSGLRLDGATALYDAVGQSARLAESSSHTRRAVVILSDGKESGGASRLDREASLRQAAASTALFYVIGVGFDVDRDYLDQLARDSGGRYFEAFGGAAVPGVYASLEQVLRSHIAVTFRSSAPPDLQDRSLSISVARGNARGTAEQTYRSLRPPVSPPAAPPPAPVAPRVEAPVPAPGDQSGGVPFLPIVILVALLGGLGGVVLLRRRPEMTFLEEGGPTADAGEIITAVRPADPVSAVSLVVVEGPEPLKGRSFGVAHAPISIGSDDECTIQLPGMPGVAGEHARLWEMDGRIMVHHLARGLTTAIDGRSVVWASLSDGDEITIGHCVLRCVRNGAAA